MPGSSTSLIPVNKSKPKHSRDEIETSAAPRRGFIGPTRSRSNAANWKGTQDDNANLRRSLDEQRLHITRLKNELGLEKERAKQVRRDQVNEVKRIRNEIGSEHNLNLEQVQCKFRVNSRKMKQAHEAELKKLMETLAKEKDLEIKQIIKFKDEEIRTMKKELCEEHAKILRGTEEQFKHKLLALKSKSPGGEDTPTERKLRQEILNLQKSKDEIEFALRAQVTITNEKKEQIVKIKSDFEKGRKENQKEHVNLLTEIKQLRKVLQDQTSAAEKSASYASQLIEEKQDLAKRLKQDRIHLQEKKLQLDR